MPERVPEDKLNFVLQIMQGIDGLSGVSDIKERETFHAI